MTAIATPDFTPAHDQRDGVSCTIETQLISLGSRRSTQSTCLTLCESTASGPVGNIC